MNITELDRNREQRLICLEGIRGLAALIVVLAHLGLTFFPLLHTELSLSAPGRVLLASPLSLVINGELAVRIFFVLSGFVLSLSYFRNKKPQVLTAAALRRYPRLMLPALASVMFAWVLLKLGWFWNGETVALMQYPQTTWLGLLFSQERSFIDALREGAFQTFFYFEPARTLNSSLWTMPWEWIGSLIVFSLLALFGRLQRRVFVYAILAITFYVMAWPFLIDFVAGVALCDLFTRDQQAVREKSPAPAWPAGALVAGLILGGLMGELPNTSQGFSAHFVWCWPIVPAALIIAGVTFSSKRRRALEGRAMRFLGRISFPLYLFHLSIICSVGCGLYVYLRRLALSHNQSALISSGICLLFLLLLAWGLYFVLELPSLRLARRAGQWFAPHEKAQAP